MKLGNVMGIALIGAVALTAGLAASPQATDSQAPRVIKTLPPVTFFGAPPAKERQAEPAAAIANRLRAEAALRAMMEARAKHARVKTVCGLTVIEQTPDLDSQILLPADRDTGAAIRKIEPHVCNAAR